jgi:hypothetical protein
MCVYCHMSKKSRVGRSALIFFFNYRQNRKVVPASRIRYFIFEISGKPSFVETVLWRDTQFFYLLCSQFRQKASGWINKTLLLIKQQKWLSEFCVKIYRVASKINKLPCLHEIDIPKCINVYSIKRTKLGVIGFFVLSFLICF